MTGLRVEHVSKRFGDVTALDDFSLEIRSGELMVLVGPSGCGKTTLLRVIIGLEQQDEGHVYVGEEVVDSVRVGQRGVQMVFQTFALWPHMKVLDEHRMTNISFPLKIRHWTAEMIGDRLRRVAQRVGLDSSLFGRKPDELSSGQKQRVALVRALVASPQVLLLDEPLSNLDPLSRVQARGEIKRLQEETGATMLYVTHNISDAFAMADRIAIMKDGKLVQVGSWLELREQPTNEFVRDYLVT